MGSTLHTLFSLLGIAALIVSSQSIILRDLRDCLILLDKQKPDGCKDKVYATLNIDGEIFDVFCGDNGDTYISATIKVIQQVETKIIMRDGHTINRLYLGKLDQFLNSLDEYKFETSQEATGVVHFDKTPYLTFQTGGLESIERISSIATLLSDFCEAPTPETTRRTDAKRPGGAKVSVRMNLVTIPVIIWCEIKVVEFYDKDTAMIDQRHIETRPYYQFESRVFDVSYSFDREYLHKWNSRHLKIVDSNKIEVDNPDLEKILIPLKIFKEDLQELWEDINSYVPKKKGFFSRKTEEDSELEKKYMSGSIGYGKKTIVYIEKSRCQETKKKMGVKGRERHDLIHLQRLFQRENGMAIPEDIFFADQIFRNNAGGEIDEDVIDDIYMKGFKSRKINENNMVKYAIFSDFENVLSMQMDYVRMAKKIGVETYPVKIRFIYGDYGIDGKVNEEGALSFLDLVVLQALRNKYNTYAKRTKYNLAVYNEEFLTQDGNLSDAFAVRLQQLPQLEKLLPYSDFIEIPVFDWKVRVSKD